MDAYQDPVEDQYPRQVLCTSCRCVHGGCSHGDHVGKIIEHEVIETQISGDDRYSCTVTHTCPGSLAKVSKWKRIP